MTSVAAMASFDFFILNSMYVLYWDAEAVRLRRSVRSLLLQMPVIEGRIAFPGDRRAAFSG